MAMDDEMQTFRPRIITNGDIVRKMTDHEIAAALSDAVRSGIAGGQNDTYKQWLEWLKKEADGWAQRNI